jgi:hypothetical protein
VEINKERKDAKIRLGTELNCRMSYISGLQTARNAPREAGQVLSATNNYVSQIGKDARTGCDRLNGRRTSKDYDYEQPEYLRLLENKSKQI